MIGIKAARRFTPYTIRRPQIVEEEFSNLEDLCVFDFKERISNHRVETFDLDRVLWSDKTDVVPDYAFLIGYPTSSIVWHFDETESELLGVENRFIIQDLQADRPQLMDTENRDMFIQHEGSTKAEVEPDGLSGSPVFSIVCDAKMDRHLRFDGIVTTALRSRFAVYPSVQIRHFLDAVADASQPKTSA